MFYKVLCPVTTNKKGGSLQQKNQEPSRSHKSVDIDGGHDKLHYLI
jgi:hypothetical protein